MRTYKIYDAVYPIEDTSAEAPDAYALKGALLDEKPNGKKVGYVTMRDGSVIECYTKFNPLVVAIPILIVVLIIAAVLIYLVFFQPKDVSVGGTIIKQGVDNNVVTYNGFMAIESDSISVDFTNGEYACTIQVIGDGIDCAPVTVQPGEYVASIPATFCTEKGLVQAKLKIETDTSSTEQDVVVEIPDNNTPDSPDAGLEGYWKGEYVYGTDIPAAE